MNRYDIERAAAAAPMPGPAFSVLMYLLTRWNKQAARILPEHSPSLRTIARATKLDKSTVSRHLLWLDEAGWVTRDRPTTADALQHQATTAYTLHIPQEYSQASRTKRPPLVAEDDTGGRSERPVPVAADDRTGRRVRHTQKETEVDQREATTSSSAPDGADEDDLAAIAKAELRELTGRTVSDRAAREAVRLVLTGRAVRNPEQYLRTALRAEPRRFAPPTGPPSWADTQADLDRIQAEGGKD